MKTDQMIAVINKFEQGGKLQARKRYDDHRWHDDWFDCLQPNWNFAEYEYRLKPVAPEEYWLCDNLIFSSEKEALEYRMECVPGTRPKIVHVRKVLE